MRIGELLACPRRVGSWRVKQWLRFTGGDACPWCGSAHWEITSDRKVGELTSRQRRLLADRLRLEIA